MDPAICGSTKQTHNYKFLLRLMETKEREARPRLWLVRVNIVEQFRHPNMMNGRGQGEDATDVGINLDESHSLIGQFEGNLFHGCFTNVSQAVPFHLDSCVLSSRFTRSLFISFFLCHTYFLNLSSPHWLAEITGNISENLVVVYKESISFLS